MPPATVVEPRPLGSSTAPVSRSVAAWLPWIGLLILWADLIHQLGYTWSNNEQYSYGWFVPVLSAALLWRSWPHRPDPGPALSPALAMGAIVALGALLIPLRVIHEINQDWPLISWALALIVVALTLLAIHQAGGWPWVRHFAFPVVFILIAVQWPYRIENTLIHGLRGVVTSITVEVLGLLNIPALQRGNLIELSTGVVGVDEACSGIRSFQSTLMGALFLGEQYRLRWGRRSILLVVGVALAFLFNVFRALFLSWNAAQSGVDAVDKWHDSAGLTIVGACFVSLWILSTFLASKIGTQPDTAASTTPAHPMPRWIGWAVPVLALGSVAGTEAWYRAQAINRVETARWWVQFPTNAPAFRPLEIPDYARRMLRFDHGVGAAWQTGDGAEATVFCFRWEAGDSATRMSAQAHRPEYCMTGSGHELKADLGTVTVSANGLDLPFRAYIFDSNAGPLHVYHCLWEDGSETQTGFGKSKLGDRLRAVLDGRRGLGQQTLEIILQGTTSQQQALSLATGTVGKAVIPDQRGPAPLRGP